MPDAGNDAPIKRLIVEKDGAIGRVKMDNQTRRNAMTLGMWQALGDAIEDFAKDDNIRVVIVSGEGGKAFCAGADFSNRTDAQMEDDNAGKSKVDDEGVQSLYVEATRIFHCKKPTVACVHGAAIGGGLGLAIG